MDEEAAQKKRSREVSPEFFPPEADTPAAKRAREDLLGLLDDSDPAPAGFRSSDAGELDSFMRSFERELSGAAAGEAQVRSVANLASDSEDSIPDLGYLLEASDGDLGLPAPDPTAAGAPLSFVEGSVKDEEKRAAESVRDSSGSDELGGLWPYESFDEGLASYDSFGFVNGGDDAGDYVSVGGVFDCSDADFGPSDCNKELSWRSETLPAL